MAFSRNQTCSRPARRQGGFTLIEMSIAVAIFGMLASGAIMATSAWLGKQAMDRTAKNLDRIESALTVYVVQNGGLPCPYNNTVTPPTALAGCATAGTPPTLAYVGIVPYRDLGLQRADVLDGWNRYITYAAESDWTFVAGNQPFFNGGTLADLSQLTTAGANANLRVQDAGEADCGAPAPTCGAYVLVSHGEDGNGAFIGFNLGQVPLQFAMQTLINLYCILLRHFLPGPIDILQIIL
jgi:prepilin-type N-terminal cleavage/methylation domain-containing protein